MSADRAAARYEAARTNNYPSRDDQDRAARQAAVVDLARDWWVVRAVDPAPDEPAPAEAPPKRGALLFETIAELCARVDAMGPRRYLVRGLWPADAYGVHAAEPKAGKTWNALDLAVAVASGRDFLGHFPIDTVGPVLIFAGEGGDGNVVRRLRAIAEHMAVDLEALPITVCCRAPHLNDGQHAEAIVDKLRKIRPALMILDPLYLSARGADAKSLIDMGEVLEGPQRACQAVGAALVVVTHFNRKEGRGASRITGAGPAEWGRVLLSASVLSRRTDEATKATTIVSEVDVVGGEVPDLTFRVRRTIQADEPDDLASPLHYEVEVLSADHRDSGSGDGMSPAMSSVLAALREADEPVTVQHLQKVIGDARVAAGELPPSRPTVSKALNALLDMDLVDEVDTGRGTAKRWNVKGCA